MLSQFAALLSCLVALTVCAEDRLDDFMDLISPQNTILPQRTSTIAMPYSRIAIHGGSLYVAASVHKSASVPLLRIDLESGRRESLTNHQMIVADNCILVVDDSKDWSILDANGRSVDLQNMEARILFNLPWSRVNDGVVVSAEVDSEDNNEESDFFGHPRRMSALAYISEDGEVLASLLNRLSIAVSSWDDKQILAVGSRSVIELYRLDRLFAEPVRYEEKVNQFYSADYLGFCHDDRFLSYSQFLGKDEVGRYVWFVDSEVRKSMALYMDDSFRSDHAIVSIVNGRAIILDDVSCRIYCYDLESKSLAWSKRLFPYFDVVSKRFLHTVRIAKDELFIVRNEGVYRISCVDGSLISFYSYLMEEDSDFKRSVNISAYIVDCYVGDNFLAVARLEVDHDKSRRLVVHTWSLGGTK